MLATAAAPAFPRRCRARRDLHRSPPRIPAGSGSASMSSMRSRNRPPARRAQVEIQQRRIGMAEMQIAVRARRKAENGWRHVDRHAGLSGIHRQRRYEMDARVKPAHDDPAIPQCHPPQHPGRSRRRHPRAGQAGPAAQAGIRDRRACRRCGGASPALPASPRSSAASNCPPRAPRRSGARLSAAFDPFRPRRAAQGARRPARPARPVGGQDQDLEEPRARDSPPSGSISMCWRTRTPTPRTTR